MLSADVFTSFPGQMWEKVLSKVNKALVFMDDPCAESLHWSGGAALLFTAGARNVKRFSSFEAGADNEPKAVFVVSTLLKGRTADIIKDIVSLSRFRYCVVLTAVPHSLHLLAEGVSGELEGNVAFTRFEKKLRGWMGNAEYTAEVLHAPVHFARASSQLLIAPAFADLFPLLDTDLTSINSKRPEKRRFASLTDLDMHSLPNELQVKIRALASALNTLFELSNTREESFTVGPMSRLIAAELANHPQAKNRRKSSAHKASVVFIDRTLDLTGAVGHHGDSLVEKILSVLPPLPGHMTDVQVDMLELTHLQRTPEAQGVLAPGCLGQTQSAAAQSLWETMLVAKQKEAVMEVRRQLVEAASKENLPIKMSLGRVTGEQLSSYVQLFRDSWSALENHCGLLQLALGTAQTLSHPSLAQWDACLAFERLLLQNPSSCQLEVTNLPIYQSGKGYKTISKALGLPRTTVRAIIYKWRKHGTVENLPRSGRPTKITPRAQRQLLQEVTKDPTTSKELQASLASVKPPVYQNVTVLALGESDLADVLKQFLPLMKSRSITEGGSESGSSDFSVDELLVLLVYVYSLAQETQASGTEEEEKVEREIIGALTLLLTQQTTLSPSLQGITGAAVFIPQDDINMMINYEDRKTQTK
ncbi:hypothetical protein QTP86_031894, partial [Hemibagrus guttatus]